MSAFRSISLLLLLPFASVTGGEVVIEKKPFVVETSFSSRAMPAGEVSHLLLDPKSWANFTVASLVDHGALVKKGEPAITFETREIDRRLEDLRANIASDILTLDEALASLKIAQDTASKRLEAARRQATRAAEELAYFTQTGRIAEQEQSAQALERRRQWLENEKEELRQLKAMYEADDLTEDTEEIILIRQQNAVRSAEFELRMDELRHQRLIEVRLPRQAIDLAEANRLAGLALKQAEGSIPRSIEQQQLKQAALETQLKRKRSELAELQQDRELFEVAAKVDSIVYYGNIENGSWTTGDVIKQLKPGGKLPADVVFMTLVPTGTPLQLGAHLSPSVAGSISPDSSGIAIIEGREEAYIPVEVDSISPVPDTSGRHLIQLNATWPKHHAAVIGTPLKVRLITHHQPEAITVPKEALHFGVEGWTVEVKLADGKGEHRKVTRGREADGRIEVLKGLEVGQVVLTP